ncbi:MAG: hypothetical protein LBU34_07340 [Planctomycetaceae bacterium]|nr:hypothetical protein [Planctomycetaceae bacterium]
MDTVLRNTEHVRLKHYIQPMPDEDYAELGQVGKGENLKFAELLQQIPTEFPTFETIFEEKLTYSDVLAAIGCDANARQKIFDCITSDPDLSVCYASVSALFKTVHGKQLWELLEEEQIKRTNTFVQSAALHFEKATKDFSNPLDRVGLEPTT